ncbi:hypothetical protein BU17DRAFT_70154 [Hysterangium stoloniferum]|nr:hypothetical protein BU17DRAFT_70154 [Hysterangium stoloniferum]
MFKSSGRPQQSRIPLKAHHPQPRSGIEHRDDQDPAMLLANLSRLSYPHIGSISTEEISRLLQGRGGEALRFLLTHMIGRERVTWVRKELHRLNRLPRSQTRVVFRPESTGERYAAAQLKLARTKAEMERKRKELEEITNSTHLRVVSSNALSDTLTETRRKEFLLRILLTKEEIRVQRVEDLKRILSNTRERRKGSALKIYTSYLRILNEHPALSPICCRRYQRPPHILQIIFLTIWQYVFVPDLHVDQKINFMISMQLVRRWLNEVKRMVGSESVCGYVYERCLPPELRNIACHPEDKSGTAMGLETRRSEILGHIDVRTISKLDLDRLQHDLVNEAQHVHGLLSLYRHLIGQASCEMQCTWQGTEKLPEDMPGNEEVPKSQYPSQANIASAGLEVEVGKFCREKESALSGYVDTLRRAITQFQVDGSNKVQLERTAMTEICATLGIPQGTSTLGVLKVVKKMVMQTATMQNILSQRPSVVIDEPPASNVHLESDSRSLILLRRKNEKMASLRPTLESDIGRFLSESASIINGRAQGK